MNFELEVLRPREIAVVQKIVERTVLGLLIACDTPTDILEKRRCVSVWIHIDSCCHESQYRFNLP